MCLVLCGAGASARPLLTPCCGKVLANHPLEPAPGINLDLQMSVPAGTGLPLAGLEQEPGQIFFFFLIQNYFVTGAS